jgi:hypothetical protein
MTSSHEMSHVSCLNSKAYTKVGHDPWQKVRNLLFDVYSLSKSPKMTPNSLRNVLKSFSKRN